MANCIDPIVGDILSSWRYDISGISPDMRKDYEEHLATCDFCRRRQRIHRVIDVALIALSSVSILVFILALIVIHHVSPLHDWSLGVHIDGRYLELTLSMAAILGLLVSVALWLLVAVATPAPVYLTNLALEQARTLQQRLPHNHNATGRQPSSKA